MKYIDAEKIRAEIERLIEINKTKNGFPAGINCAIRIEAYETLLPFLDTLEEEPVGEELEKEIEKTWLEYECYNEDYDKVAEMRWNEFENVARHFAEWQKEQMLKDAVEGGVYFQLGDIMRVQSDDFENPDIHLGDKVKLIVVKQNEK